MARRLLLFIVCCFVSVSITHAQCDKVYNASVNNKQTISSMFNGAQHSPLNLCKGSDASFHITNLDADVLKIRWFRNDSLIATTPDLKTNVKGMYSAEIETKTCLYKLGMISVDFSENLQVSLTEKELTVCENGSSYFYVYASVISSMPEVQYQWQKDGKDLPEMTKNYFGVSTPGSYTLRATAGACSSTSQPTVVKGNKDNLLTNLISYSNGNAINKDTAFFCKDYPNTFSSAYHSEWYLDGKYVSTGYTFTPTQSGLYTNSYSFGNNCFSKSKPLYVSIDTKISPIEPDFLSVTNQCTTKGIQIINPNLKTPSTLKLYDFTTNDLLYSYSPSNESFYQSIPNGKYKVELEKGSCKSIPSYWDLSKNRLFLKSSNKNIGGEKIDLCNNNYLDIYVTFSTFDEVSLYKDGILLEKRPNFKHGDPIYFRVVSSGKYHITTLNKLCPEKGETLSDTVEVVIAEPIYAKLNLTSTSCDSYSLAASQQEGFSYYWYKDNTIIPNENTSTLKLTNNSSSSYHAVLQKGLCSVATQYVTLGNKIIGDINICEGTTFELEAKQKNADISWQGPNGFTSKQPIIRIDTAKAEHGGLYILSTNANGCNYKDSINLQFTAKPNLSLEFIGPLCTNQDLIVKFKGTPGYYYISYSFSGGTGYGTSFELSGNYEYYNLGKVRDNDKISNFFTFAVDPDTYSIACTFPIDIPPHTGAEFCNDIFEFTNLQETYCYQEKTTLKFKLPADLPSNKKLKISLKTYWNIYPMGTFSGDSVVIVLPDVNDSGLYFIIEDEDGKLIASSKSFKVTGARPSINAIIGNISASGGVSQCEGYSTLLRIGNYQTIQWKRNGIDIPGATNYELVTKESGIYTVAVKQDGCAFESSNLHVKLGSVPKPYVSSLLNIYSACDGYSVPLNISGGFPYTNFEWKRNGEIVEKNSTEKVFNAKESGYYTVTAYQGSCKETSDSVLIEIGNKLSNTISAYGNTEIGDNKIVICDQGQANFYHRNYYFRNPSNNRDTTILQKYGFNFQWKRDDKNIAGANYGSYSSGESGIYYLQLRQGDCIVNSNKIEVIKQNTFSVKLLNSYTYSSPSAIDTFLVCNGAPFDLYPSQSSDVMYNWNKELYKDGKLVESYSAKKGNNYRNYFLIKDSGKYSIKLYPESQKSCIAYSDTSNILFSDQPLHLPIDTVFSCDDQITLYGPDIRNITNSYQWSFNGKIIGDNSYYLTTPFEEGIYTAAVKQTETCSIIQPILVKKNTEAILFSESHQNISSIVNLCEGMNNRLVTFINGGDETKDAPNYSVEWYRNQQKLPDTTTFIHATQSGEYFVRTKYKGCEATSNSLKVNVSQINKQISPLTDSLALCINGGFETLEASKENGYIYEWFKDNTSLEETASSLKVTQAGIYKALIQSGDCSALTSSVKIYPSTQLPTATISGDTLLNVGDTANLKLSFTSNPPFTYKLSNNQEGTSQTNTIIHPIKVEEAGPFKLASVKNACGEGTVSGEAKIQVIILANEPLIGHKVIVAPVPAESYCEIIFDLPTSQEVSYQLLDVKGQKLSEKNIGQVTYKKQYLNLNHLTAGEYLIRIQIGKDFVTRKLIKF